MTHDALIRDHGSVWTILPLTDAATDWLAEHTPDDAPMFGDAIAVEVNYVRPILEGMVEAGLSLARG